jgi:hypothetical protein
MNSFFILSSSYSISLRFFSIFSSLYFHSWYIRSALCFEFSRVLLLSFCLAILLGWNG